MAWVCLCVSVIVCGNRGAVAWVCLCVSVFVCGNRDGVVSFSHLVD